MKRKTYFLISALFVIFLSSTGIMAAVKSFEGIITYKISYPDSKYTESQQAMLPKMVAVTIKGPNSKSEIKTGMGNQVEIKDFTNKTSVTLIDMMGQKYAVKSTAEEIEKENAKEPKPTIEITKETKVIAGYTCKKAIVTVNDDGVISKYDVFFTDELGPKAANFDNPLYKDIDGVMLEFSMKTPQFTMVFSATAVEKKSISGKEFDIPSDFTPITKDELKTKFGGMGQ
jgi:GLPGLI family protein